MEGVNTAHPGWGSMSPLQALHQVHRQQRLAWQVAAPMLRWWHLQRLPKCVWSQSRWSRLVWAQQHPLVSVQSSRQVMCPV
jgi:hypothetical protein